MQHRYACDIGDFAKYSLLSTLAAEDLRLGVVWYLNHFEEQNEDGRFIEYRELRECNERLYALLEEILRREDRNLSAIERSGALPKSAFTFRRPFLGSPKGRAG